MPIRIFAIVFPRVNAKRLRYRALQLSGISVLRIWLATFIFLSLIACASLPSERFKALCPSCATQSLPYHESSVSTYISKTQPNPVSVLHVYIEGDGQPWSVRNKPTKNPSSQELLAFRLFLADPFESVYLNRPCYGLDRMPSTCTEDLWTHGRYSKAVIKALLMALKHIQRQWGAQKLILIGHSGGATLALLLAAEYVDSSAVVAVAPNLDHRAWTGHFNYLPLHSSIDVAEQAVLPEAIHRWYLLGEQDRQIPLALSLPAARQDPHGTIIRRADYDHSCCWESEWSELITALRAEVGTN